MKLGKEFIQLNVREVQKKKLVFLNENKFKNKILI
jgi:hypothetical protein